MRTSARSLLAALGILTVSISMLSACFTGERATVDTSETMPSPVSTTLEAPDTTIPPGAPKTAAALASLFGAPAKGPETATFEIRPTDQAETVTAVVTRDATRTVVSVRDVQFRSGAAGPSTCRQQTDVCTPGFNSQPLSDLGITAQFWGPSVRQELRSPTLAARIGPVTTTDTTIAGQVAVCIDVPGPDLTVRYCALPTGMLASKSTARVAIELVAYSDTFDEQLWAKFPGN
ncbi:MAG: hypothetical protein F2873_07780 [Actinobacteria bacterium]|nr:hypothetical protein [Actinomycetota bacterium]MSX80418.1 hypothetical protein [Actinomycetota bacterium]